MARDSQELGKVAKMAVGDISRLTINQSLLGQQVLNVFWYRLSQLGTGGNDAAELIDTFATDVWGDVVAIQNGQVETTLYEAVNFNDLTDFASLTSNATGSRTGDVLPVFTSWTFQLKRAALTLRNGRKAVAGVSESDQADGQPTAGIQGLLNDAAASMAADLVSADGALWEPVIVRKPTVPLPTIPTFVRLNGVEFKRISTQNSRKPF